MPDQAEPLRRLIKEQMAVTSPMQTRLVAVASGKGGVGKTNIVLNLALTLASHGKKVAVLDGDFGFSNIDILLGLKPEYSLQDVLDGKVALKKALMTGPHELYFVSGGAGIATDDSRSQAGVSRLAKELHTMDGEFDQIFIDFGAGFGTLTSEMMRLCDDLLLVVTPENTSVADAYALLKMMSHRGSVPQIQLVVNRVSSFVEGAATAERFMVVVGKFLRIDMKLLGYVLEDTAVSRAVNRQVPFMIGEPQSAVAKCMHQLAKNTLSEVAASDNDHGIKAFFKRFFKRNG